MERCHDICKIFCDISLFSSCPTFCNHLYSKTECLSHSREDYYKRTLEWGNIWFAHGKDNWSYSCVRISLSSTADFLMLSTSCSSPWGIGSGMLKYCFPRQSIIPILCHTRSTIPDCRAYQQVYAFAFLR